MNRLVATCALAVFAAPFAYAQMGGYLDMFMVKVKPDRRADFDVIGRKIADSNRKAKGDTWIAMEVTYGESNTIYFSSRRKDYAAIDAASTAFENAIKEAYGPGGMKKMLQDFNSTIVSSRGELRHRRLDLSMNAPKDEAALNKLVGEARWIRTLRVQVRPGFQAEFEDSAKQVKAAYEQGSPSYTVLASQTVAGEPGTVYYFSSFQPSLGGFDSAPDLRKLMGDEAFMKWQKGTADTVVSSETMLLRLVPELSNAPEEIASVSPNFWHPKPPVPIRQKPAPQAAKPGQ
jgi:hypothetical protein